MQQFGFVYFLFLKARLGVSFQQCVFLVKLDRGTVPSPMKTAQIFQMGKQFTDGLIRLKKFKLISQ